MTIKQYRYFLLNFLLSLCFQSLVAQENYAILRKNLNISAKGLSHELCKTKDTLILQSDKKIDYVYTINSSHKRELDTYVFENPLKIPLNKFTKGRHVFVVEQNKMNIVFVVQIQESFSEMALVSEEKGVSNDN